MAQKTNAGEVTKYKSQTRYIFAHAETGEVIRSFTEESFTPVPEEGTRVSVGDSLARPDDDGEWIIEERDADVFIVTGVEYEYDNIVFEADEATARRLITNVWIFGMPIINTDQESN